MTQGAANSETLEQLLSALFDGDCSAAQRARLNELLRNDPVARTQYREYCEMHSMLRWHHGVLGGLEKIAFDSPTANNKTSLYPPLTTGGTPRSQRWWLTATATAVAALLLLTVGVYGLRNNSESTIDSADARTDEFAARVTGLKDCIWSNQMPGELRLVGADVRQGQHLQLDSGFAEITFGSGAQLVLEGPASLDVASPWEAMLNRGSVRASVPQEAQGFRVSSKDVDVAEPGSEFSMLADETGETEILVHKGELQVAPRESANDRPAKVRLRENEASRFGLKGIFKVKDVDKRLNRLRKRIAFERNTQIAGGVHWSFDKLEGARFKAANKLGAALDASIENSDGGHAGLIDGRWDRALHCDGQFSVRAALPESSLPPTKPRTVSFWIRVPPTAALTDNTTALAFIPPEGRENRKMGRAIRIGWNHNPAFGALGALRTDVSMGSVVGSTNLRDGQWHHAAIVLLPGPRVKDPIQAHLYVDGRLEAVKTPRTKKFKENGDGADDATAASVLVIGSGSGPKKTVGFVGDLDELYIVDRALSPQEITLLMQENKLPAAEHDDSSEK